MKYLYKVDDTIYEYQYHTNGMSQSRTNLSMAEVEQMVASGNTIFGTLDEIGAYFDYAILRGSNYPAIEDQFDQIFHEGIDAWKETIQAVKDAHPKPEW